MEVTNVKIRHIFACGECKNDRLRAIASIVIDGEFAVHELRVIEGVERVYVAMPNKPSENGSFQDIAHPISSTARALIEKAVLDTYYSQLEHQHAS